MTQNSKHQRDPKVIFRTSAFFQKKITYVFPHFHPLEGAQNSVEQLVLIVALVGCCSASAAAWGLPGLPAASSLALDTVVPATLGRVVCSLLQALPERRSLRPLLLSDRVGGVGAALARQEHPNKEGGASQACETRHHVEDVSGAAALARLPKRRVVDNTLDEQIHTQEHQKQTGSV